MSDFVFIICLILMIMLLGVVVVLAAYIFISRGDTQIRRREEPDTFYTPTAIGRYWHIEIWNATENQVYIKDFCGQIMLGRSTPTTEPFWQMRIGDNKTISREQCVVYDRSGFLVVENVSQINQTLLNGYPVTMPMMLQEGSQLSVGNNILYVTKIGRAV